MATKKDAKKQENGGTNALIEIKKETADIVLSKVQVFHKNGELDLPPNYSPSNALKSAWLMLQGVKDRDDNPALQVCTRTSIANALLNMVIQGLNPAKDQCYFIVYGTTLTLQRSYHGARAVALRVDDRLDDIYAEVIYKGDELDFDINLGQRYPGTHHQKFQNIDDNNIVGAYAVAIGKDGKVRRCELMTIKQIHQSWKQSPMKPVNDDGTIKPNSVHAKFPVEQCRKTVVNKISKHIINASSDSGLDILIGSIRRTDEEAYEAETRQEIEDFANSGEVIDIGDHKSASEAENGTISESDEVDQPEDDSGKEAVQGKPKPAF